MARVGGGAGGHKKKDKYGVSKYKKGKGTKKHTGTRQMKGKSGDHKMYVYNRTTGQYTAKTKAQVKKLEKSGGGVGSTKDSKYRLVTKGTYEKAKKQKLTRKQAPKSPGGRRAAANNPKYSRPGAVKRKAAGKGVKGSKDKAGKRSVRATAANPASALVRTRNNRRKGIR